MVWDFTCSDTIASSHIQIFSVFPGKVSENAETAKLTKYCNLSADYEIVSIGVAAFSSWSPNRLNLIRDREKIAQGTEELRSTSFLLEAISIAIQRGNACSVLGTIASPKKLEEIFFFCLLQTIQTFLFFGFLSKFDSLVSNKISFNLFIGTY